ncbi:hypothetical protein PHMEG_00040430 [Phytophthora megakarya]|uniref:Gamma-glutamylcyclotransferase family protein n=1 Tax=Phytophthora megakarya TaxID=4795 RepID=A0A225UDK6_9STRA|nr:hypothetical protein PHMEG_00040430 [Phytophthora megakarya]
MTKYFVFVYGTLKRGLFNFETYLKPAIEQGKVSFVGAARTSHAEFRMVLDNKGFYPCLFRVADGIHVSGEVFCVDNDTLVALDRLEQVDKDLYRREELDVELLDGERKGMTIKSLVYLTPVTEALLKLERIANYEPEMNVKFANWFRENEL